MITTFIRTKNQGLVDQLQSKKFITGRIERTVVDDDAVLVTLRSNIILSLTNSYYLDIWDSCHPRAAHIYTTMDDIIQISMG